MRDINSFVMYYDWYLLIKDFSIGQKGLLFEMIFCHCQEYSLPECNDILVKNVFDYVAVYLDRDKQKYIQKCIKNEENARKRYEKKQNKKDEHCAYDLDAYERKLNEE